MFWGGMPEDEKFDQGFEISFVLGDITLVFFYCLRRGLKVMHLFDLNPLIKC
jgi:hypothetical protein